MNKGVETLQIGRKIYYDKLTGEVLVNTGEVYGEYGSVKETTQEEDFANYPKLIGKTTDEVGVIQLPYGKFADKFSRTNGIRVDVDTKEIEFSFPDPNKPLPQEPVFIDNVKDELKSLKSADLDNKEAIISLYEMLLGGIM